MSMFQPGYKMFCRECGSPMYLDDVDYEFKGKHDDYWNCEKCQASCIVEVRFSKKHRELWHSENNGVKDITIKYCY